MAIPERVKNKMNAKKCNKCLTTKMNDYYFFKWFLISRNVSKLNLSFLILQRNSWDFVICVNSETEQLRFCRVVEREEAIEPYSWEWLVGVCAVQSYDSVKLRHLAFFVKSIACLINGSYCSLWLWIFRNKKSFQRQIPVVQKEKKKISKFKWFACANMNESPRQNIFFFETLIDIEKRRIQELFFLNFQFFVVPSPHWYDFQQPQNFIFDSPVSVLFANRKVFCQSSWRI